MKGTRTDRSRVLYDALRHSEEWMDHAACKGMDQSIFFPDDMEYTSKARLVCMGCSVIDDCLEYALRLSASIARQDDYGIIANTTPAERATMLAKRRKTDRVCDECREPCSSRSRFCSNACRQRDLRRRAKLDAERVAATW